MKPYVGAVVHLRLNGNMACRASVVTLVNAGSVELTVFPPRPGQVLAANAVKEDQEKGTDDSWHWPCDKGDQ